MQHRQQGAVEVVAALVHYPVAGAFDDRERRVRLDGAEEVAALLGMTSGRRVQPAPDAAQRALEMGQRAGKDVAQVDRAVRVALPAHVDRLHVYGKVVDVLAVTDDDEVLMITAKGKIQRLRAADISTIGRNTQGVRIIRLDNEDTLSSCAVIASDALEAEAAAALKNVAVVDELQDDASPLTDSAGEVDGANDLRIDDVGSAGDLAGDDLGAEDDGEST